MNNKPALHSILESQNNWLKIAVFFIGLLGGLVLPCKALIVQTILFFMYLLLDIRLYRNVWIGFKKIIMFLTAYWIFGMIFNLDYIKMVEFNLRLVYLLVITVFIIGTLNMQNMSAVIKLAKHSAFWKNTLLYLISTVLFINVIHDEFKKENLQVKNMKNLDQLLNLWISVWHNSWLQVDRVRHQSTSIICDLHTDSSEFFTFNNLLGFVFLTLMVFCFSI